MSGGGRFLNSHVAGLEPYRAAPQEIWERDYAEWDGILKLDWNEATVEPPPGVKGAIMDFVGSRDFLRLYPATANPELVGLLAAYSGVAEGNVQYFAGSDSAHENIARAFLSPGDRVLILWPTYDNFRSTAESAGAEVAYSELGEDFRFDMRRFEEDMARVSPRMAYICNPNNPTGLLLPKGEIESLLSRHPDTLFVIDEAYAEFAGQTANGLAASLENAIVTHTMSKAFALANIRFGYAVSHEGNIGAIDRVRNRKSVPTLTQVAAAEALKNPGYMWDYVGEVRKSREWFLEAVNGGGLSRFVRGHRSSANFVMLQCADADARERLYAGLRQRDVLVRRLGQSEALSACLRVTVGTMGQMRRVEREMRRVLCDGA